MQARESIHIGTSGWNYRHWVGPFYPENLPANRLLSFYAGQFATVEINNSFYHLPPRKTFESWRSTVPEAFVFSVKASRYITHMKKLREPAESIYNFFQRVRELGPKLGPILFQLPPRWRCNPERLAAFLGALPVGHRYAFEFRDASWFQPIIYESLSKHGAAFCIYHLAGELSPKEVTADFVYVRLHGPAGAYEGQYDTQTLAGWAGAFSTWVAQGKDVFCYFDNDQGGYAAQDALRLKEMIGS